MAHSDLSLSLKLVADAARFVSGLTQGERQARSFSRNVQRDFDDARRAAGNLRNQVASLGLSIGFVATLAQSARLDKSLTQIGQTAGVSVKEVAGLREELFRMSAETGQQVDDLKGGFDSAVQSGLSFKEALPVIDATNKAMAVTGANAQRLTAGLGVAATAFNFDLAKPGEAVLLLDKMTVAGRLGNAELENLADIFARVGVNAAGAGFGFDKTLAFVEVLSKVERQPERLATLADSTLRLFTNLNYAKEAAKATGVRFFDSSTGQRRDPVAVLRDIKTQYDKLNTDRDRAIYLQKAFGKADLDTIKGLKTLLGNDLLDQVGSITTQIAGAGGTLQRDLPNAISNAVDQTGRLKSELRKAADGFVQPINDAIQNVIKYGLDKKQNGGLGLDGTDVAIGGAAIAAGSFVAAKFGGKAISSLAGKFGGTAAGVATGKALEAAAGVTPVFVVNMPSSMGTDLPSGLPTAAGKYAPRIAGAARTAAFIGSMDVGLLASSGAAGASTVAGGALAAGAVGYGVGTLLNKYLIDGTVVGDKIGEGVARVLALFGNEDAQRALEINTKMRDTKIGGKLQIEVRDGKVARITTKSDNPDFDMSSGYSMMGS